MKSFLHSTPISRFFSTPKPQHNHLIKTPFLHVLHFSTAPTATPSGPYRRNEAEIYNVRVSVWWDFENCCLPANGNVFKVAQFITAAVRANGIKGPVSITAFGDVLQMSRENQKGLSDTGISLTHIPNGGKNGADRSLLVDLMYWVSQNPPPAHLFLISGDPHFASVLHRLRMNNYNILLASSDSAPGVLCSSASIMWQWSALVRGENLTGKYFNQPPDGPYASWYGRYNLSLSDPFAVIGQPSNIRADEIGQPSNIRGNEVSECGPDMLHPIPDTVVKQIRDILNSYPKGILAVDLRAELRKSNDSIDKYYFGYRKFSRFLLAMPQILNLKQDMTGQYIVHGVPTKIYGENDPANRSSVGPVATKDEGLSSSNAVKQNGQKSSSNEFLDIKPLQCLGSELKVSGSPTKPMESMKVHGLPKPYTEGVNEKLSPPSSQVPIVGNRKMPDCRKSQVPSEHVDEEASRVQIQNCRKSQEPREDAQETARVVQEASEMKIVGTPELQDCKKSQEPSDGVQETARVIQEADKMKVANSELLVTDDHSSVSESSIFKKILKWWSGSENGVYNAKESTVVDTTSRPGINTKEKKEAKVSDDGTGPPISSSVITACNSATTANKVAGNSEATAVSSAQSSSLFNKITSWFRSFRSLKDSDDGSSEKSQKPDSSSHRLFSEDSFWNDMKAFLNTPNCSRVVLKAETRSQVGRALQRDGPLALISLSDDELLQLVGMLISDKKWVEESASPSSPFKFKSKITDVQLQSDSLRRHQLSGERKFQHPPHVGVAQPARRKFTAKSRSEILADVRNLVQFIVKAHPKGYNMSLFDKLFLDRFGYPLEFQNLGYTKLSMLLRIMPGIRIEKGIIMPFGKGVYAKEEPQKDRGNEFPWEELGPLSAAFSDEKPTKSKKKAEENMKGQVQPHCELLSEDDLSDSSEDETTKSAKLRGRDQLKGSDEDSALSIILNSHYGRKEGSIRTSNSDIVDSSDEYVEDGTPAACRSRKSFETDMVYGRHKTPAESCKILDTLRSIQKDRK